MQIYIARNGSQTGPFTEEQTREMLSSGAISPDDLAWTEGAPDWKPVRSALSLPQPPPLPGSSSASGTPAQPGSGPRGVGGWLLFFCISLTILSPLISINQMVSTWKQVQAVFETYPAIKSAMFVENIGGVMLLIYSFIAGCLIWRGHQKGRKIARQFLLISLLGFIGMEVIALAVMQNLPKEIVTGGINGAGGAMFRRGIYFFIWWFYFKKSKRVRNTYGDEQADPEPLPERVQG